MTRASGSKRKVSERRRYGAEAAGAMAAWPSACKWLSQLQGSRCRVLESVLTSSAATRKVYRHSSHTEFRLQHQIPTLNPGTRPFYGRY